MICQPQDCFGCAVCHDVCPVNAIEMKDDTGWWRPVINAEICTHCDACKKTCPALTTIEKKEYAPVCYAGWTKDRDRHYNCASGGIATELAINAIKKGWFVVGAYFNAGEGKVKHAVVDTVDDVMLLSKSKYVLSNKENVYREIERRLELKQNGLFIGIPCEVNALNAYIKTRGLSRERIYTVDLLCHGGSSSLCLSEHMNCVARWHKVHDISFRGGKYDCQFVVWGEKKQPLYRGFQYTDSYFKYFMQHSLFQAKCYECPFAGNRRIGDLTLGDFWDVDSAIEHKNPSTGISLILVNTERGHELLEQIRNQIELYERPFSEAIDGNDTLKEPTSKPDEYEELWEIIKTEGFNAGLKKIYGMSEVKNYIRNSYLRKRQSLTSFVKLFAKELGGGVAVYELLLITNSNSKYGLHLNSKEGLRCILMKRMFKY